LKPDLFARPSLSRPSAFASDYGEVGGSGASNPLAVASLVLGILSFLAWGCCCLGSIIPFVDFFLAVGAVVTGALGVKSSGETGTGKGMAIAGIVLGALSLLILAAWAVFMVFFGGLAAISAIANQ
jgi:hypothetical protein